jgi:4-oxalocrotonate tautomerase
VHIDAASQPRGKENIRQIKAKLLENNMPLIEVHLIENVFNAEQKGQMIKKLTDAMVSIEGENMRAVTWCVIEEVESGDWGIGGNALTTADVHALAQGKAA